MQIMFDTRKEKWKQIDILLWGKHAAVSEDDDGQITESRGGGSACLCTFSPADRQRQSRRIF